MINNVEHIELVKKAQLGNKGCLSRLAELSRDPLQSYVYRITLRENLAQDIAQESMLEMFKVLGKLKRADRFWPWLCGIALNKIRRHYQNERRRKTISMSRVGDGDWLQGKLKDSQVGLANLVGQELKQIVFNAMRELKPRHREVLAMRCYEEMEYAKIAELMGCSEFGVRMLFYRAKKSLVKQLSRNGFGKGSLLTALILFGKMTAPSQAAAAKISVTSAGIKVGLAASMVGLAGSMPVIISLTAAGVVAVGSMVMPPGTDKPGPMPLERAAKNFPAMSEAARNTKGIEECWYYFPKGANKPVMIRLLKWDAQGKQSYCQWLQNDRANYYFDKRQNTIYINNHHMWQSDLTVQRLPTDKEDINEFLSRVEGDGGGMEYVPSQGGGLLVIARRNGYQGSNRSWMTRHYNVLEEEYFQYDWPVGAKLVDNRDAMHRRGWTYFRITGEIGGDKVSGVGRIPFMYATSKIFSGWLRMKVGDRLEIIDSGAEARVLGPDGVVTAKYKGGSFFKGLSRPWMGLHTIDIVRRDAARSRVWFETRYIPGQVKAEVILTPEQGTRQWKLVYIIDMEKDVIDQITLSPADSLGKESKQNAGQNAGNAGGVLKFSYLADLNQPTDEFIKPRKMRGYQITRPEELGMLWLIHMADGTLGD